MGHGPMGRAWPRGHGPWAMAHGVSWCCPWLRTWPRGLAHSPGPLCPAHCARRIVPGPWAWPISLAHAWARPIWPRPVVPAPLCPPHCARPIGPGPLRLVHSARPTGPRPIDELWLPLEPTDSHIPQGKRERLSRRKGKEKGSRMTFEMHFHLA